MGRTLVLDAGNTTLKAGVAQGPELLWQGRPERDSRNFWSDFVAKWQISRALILQGNACKYTDDLNDLRAEVAIQVVGVDYPLPDCGQYATCGGDRVCAGIGAVCERGVSQVVVDAGTATTVSAWRRAAGPWPRFAGGLILPGAQACLQGLHAAAPALPLVQPMQAADPPSACQHSTPGALTAAMALGYPAMVSALVEQVCSESGISQVLMTGGNMGHLTLKAAHDPDLVLKGLARVAADYQV